MDTVLESMWRKYRTLLDSEVSSSNYRERFALLLSCEEHQMQLDIRNYDMEVPILFSNIVYIGGRHSSEIAFSPLAQ